MAELGASLSLSSPPRVPVAGEAAAAGGSPGGGRWGRAGAGSAGRRPGRG